MEAMEILGEFQSLKEHTLMFPLMVKIELKILWHIMNAATQAMDPLFSAPIQWEKIGISETFKTGDEVIETGLLSAK
jgi:hypothetical protein